jgi:hypothetical protein
LPIVVPTVDVLGDDVFVVVPVDVPPVCDPFDGLLAICVPPCWVLPVVVPTVDVPGDDVLVVAPAVDVPVDVVFVDVPEVGTVAVVIPFGCVPVVDVVVVGRVPFGCVVAVWP